MERFKAYPLKHSSNPYCNSCSEFPDRPHRINPAFRFQCGCEVIAPVCKRFTIIPQVFFLGGFARGRIRLRWADGGKGSGDEDGHDRNDEQRGLLNGRLLSGCGRDFGNWKKLSAMVTAMAFPGNGTALE